MVQAWTALNWRVLTCSLDAFRSIVCLAAGIKHAFEDALKGFYAALNIPLHTFCKHQQDFDMFCFIKEQSNSCRVPLIKNLQGVS